MPELQTKFDLFLGSHALHRSNSGSGLVCLEWEPTPERSLLVLNTGDPNVELIVWLQAERLQYADESGRIYLPEHDDSSEIYSCYLTDYLHGRLILHEVPHLLLDAVRTGDLTDPHYEDLAKRIVEAFYPSIVRLVNLLRTHYGQFWIRPMDEDLPAKAEIDDMWGMYSLLQGMFGLHYTLDNGASWHPFYPSYGSSPWWDFWERSYPCEKYLTQQDWEEIGNLVEEKFEVSRAAYALTRAHELREQRRWKAMLVELVTAFDFALTDFVAPLLSEKDKREFVKQCGASVSRKFRFLNDRNYLYLPKERQDMVKLAITLRNKAAHETLENFDGDESAFMSEVTYTTVNAINVLFSTVSELLPGPQFRFVRQL